MFCLLRGLRPFIYLCICLVEPQGLHQRAGGGQRFLPGCIQCQAGAAPADSCARLQ